MGWSILAGGQISRVVHGGDDLASERYVPSFNILPNDADNPTSTYAWQLKNNGPRDSEPDAFSYSFGGYSGKFVFDHQGNILNLPASNLKIAYNNTIDDSWTFSIITPDGIKYIFGGLVAKEETKFGNTMAFNSFVPNVWHLNKIVHPSGYSISFVYERILISPYFVGKSQTHYKLSYDAGVPVCTGSGWDDPACVDGVIPVVYDQDISMTSYVSLLKEINTTYGAKVTFSYSTQGYPEKIVNDIKYYNENGLQVQRYALEYHVSQTGNGDNLPFLKSIKEYDAQGSLLNPGHAFFYNNLNAMPNRISFSQDHWGYFNGKFNQTLVARPEDEELAFQFPLSTANREPDPLYAINGLMSKIVYPTGGNDTIYYEPNIVIRAKDMNPYDEKYQSIIGTGTTYVETAGVNFSITYENKVKVVMKCDYLGTSGFDPLHDKGRIRVVDLATNADIFDRYFVPNSGVSTEFPMLPPGNYKLYASARGQDVRIDGKLTHRTGTAPSMQDVDVIVGGMRVKKTITADVFVNKPVVKRYYYGTMANLNVSSASNVPIPRYYTPFNYTVGFTSAANCYLVTKTYAHKALHFASLNKSYLYNGRLVAYQTVIESIGGDNFENGAIEHKFHNVNDLAAQPIRGWVNMEAPVTNTSYMSKGEVETNVYSKKSGALVLLSTKLADVTIDTRKFKELSCMSVHQAGALICSMWSGTTLVGPDPLHHQIFHISKYYLTSAWKYLSKETLKQYDENGLNPITKITDYLYDDDRNLMLSRTETTDSKGDIVKTQTKYPHDFALTGNVYEDMVNKNIIANPVEVNVSKNNQLLLTTKTNYANNWFTDKHLIAINNVEVQKNGFNNEERFKYYEYDTYGNPISLSKTNDALQSVIWDYNSNHPVAKVINADNASIAYTSFEADGHGNFTFSGSATTDVNAPTGKKVYSLSGGTIYKTVDAGKTYTVSFWATGTVTVSGGTLIRTGKTLLGYTYYEYTVSSTSLLSLSGSALIDEIRLYPLNAAMSTYTYDPGVGATSSTDENNHLTYYEYDGFNRLMILRNEDRNILKQYEYKYQNYGVNPIWQATGTTRCKPCPQNNAYITNILQQEEKDINTESPTYNQIRWVDNGLSLACDVNADWQNISPAVIRCKTNGANENTGEQEQQQMDMNPCHGTYGQTRWVSIGINTTACPIPAPGCNSGNCSGMDKKCINGVCETGVKTCKYSTWNAGAQKYNTYFWYVWSNGSHSTTWVELTSTACGAVDQE